jgi:hypothetical protein
VRTAALALVLVGCAGGSPGPAFCSETTVALVDGPLLTPVRTTRGAVVRVSNPTPLPVVLRDMVLEGDGDFSFPEPVEAQLLGPGACQRPTVVDLALAFTPDRVGTRAALLRGVLGDRAFAVALAGVGTGAVLEVPQVVSFGTTSVGTRTTRDLVLRNTGTVGTSVEVVVESVRAMNAETDVTELCIGATPAGCGAATRLGVMGTTRVPVSLEPRRAGTKAFEVTLRTAAVGEVRQVVPVVAFALDTRGCSPVAAPLAVTLSPDRSTAAIRVRNQGTQPCRLLGATADAPVTVSASRPQGTLLQPTDALDLIVGLQRPGTFVAATAAVRVRFDGSPDLEVPVTVRASGLQACLQGFEYSLDFGVWREDCVSVSRTIFLHNACAAPISLERVWLRGPFSLVSSTVPVDGGVLVSGMPLALTVRPSPGQPGGEGALGLVTGVGEVVMGLQSRTEPARLLTDTFPFLPAPRADVLYVVDDAPAFGPARVHVADGLLQSMTSMASTFEHRARLAVTSTRVEGPRAGVLRQVDGGTWFQPPAGQPSDVSPWAGLDDGGVGRRSCVEAAALAMARVGFRRADVPGVVVCATAAADEAVDPVAARGALRDAGVVHFIVLSPQSAACGLALVTDGGHAESAAFFPQGWWADVCGGWGAAIWGSSSHPSSQRYFLSSAVGPQRPVEVSVNGTPFPATLPDGGAAWWVDPTTNSLHLAEPLEWSHPEVLNQASTLTVRYAAGCAP